MDLAQAAADGDTHTITSLLNSKTININSQNKINGWTALHWACKRNQIPTVKLLLAHGADHTIKNFKNQTPLQVSQNPEIIKSILIPTLNSHPSLLELIIDELSENSLGRILQKLNLNSKQELLLLLVNNHNINH